MLSCIFRYATLSKGLLGPAIKRIPSLCLPRSTHNPTEGTRNSSLQIVDWIDLCSLSYLHLLPRNSMMTRDIWRASRKIEVQRTSWRRYCMAPLHCTTFGPSVTPCIPCLAHWTRAAATKLIHCLGREYCNPRIKTTLILHIPRLIMASKPRLLSSWVKDGLSHQSYPIFAWLLKSRCQILQCHCSDCEIYEVARRQILSCSSTCSPPQIIGAAFPFFSYE